MVVDPRQLNFKLAPLGVRSANRKDVLVSSAHDHARINPTSSTQNSGCDDLPARDISRPDHAAPDSVKEVPNLLPNLKAKLAALDKPTAPVMKPQGRAMDLVDILSAAQETAYIWDIATDVIEWESNAAEILNLPQISQAATGARFQLFVAPEHVNRRADALAGNSALHANSGIPFRVQYRFMPDGRRSQDSLWLEDHGRWWPDANGNPVKVRGVVRVINERYWEEQRLLYRSDYDELTGLLNRSSLTEALDVALTRSVSSGVPCAYLVAAVTNLSIINETFGFEVGDEVISASAKLIKEHLRGGDTIGRYSSNKFGIILHDCSPSSLRVAAQRFMAAVRAAPIETSLCQVSATLSIGGVLIPDQAATVQQAASHAMWALDKAKQKRQEGFSPYNPGSDMASTRRKNIKIAEEITAALRDDQMLLALQPMINCQTREADLYECLLRIKQPDGTIASAAEFIVVGEQLGMAGLIDRRTLEMAIDILQKYPTIKLSLNVSGLTAGDHDWLMTLHRLSGGNRELTSRLWIEITETAAVDDLDQTINFVDMLKELGCKVAIDDFGAGYTSFKNLKLLDVDMVKIDGSFVKNLAEDTTDQIFIETMVKLAQSFGMDTVAEWVGDEATADILKQAGITHMQGFLFGQPLPAEQMLAAPHSLRAALDQFK